MFSRVVYGARVSLRIGIIATAMALIIGVFLGAIAGFFGGVSDTCIMRLTDIFLAIPYIVLAVAIATILGRSENTVILVLGLTGWLAHQRASCERASCRCSEQEYVEAARALGCRATRIIIAPHPAERAPADHRVRHDRRRQRDPRRGGAVVPRRRRRRTRRPPGA